jgi:hypothetical protein
MGGYIYSYMKYIITESQNKIFQRLRRLQELRDIIEYQTEIQYLCNFDDGDEYASFCIDQGLSFFYKDEGYDDSDEEIDYDDQPEREEVENLMYKEYYDDLVSMWEEDNEC